MTRKEKIAIMELVGLSLHKTFDLTIYKKLYEISNDIRLRILKLSLNRFRDDEITFNEELFHLGLRLALQGYVALLFHQFKIAHY